MQIFYSSKFAREYKKLSEEMKDMAEQQEIVFRKNPFDPKLKTHKLKGKLEGFLAFSIDYKYRIIFEFAKNGKDAHFHSVGDHDIYQL